MVAATANLWTIANSAWYVVADPDEDIDMFLYVQTLPNLVVGKTREGARLTPACDGGATRTYQISEQAAERIASGDIPQT